LHEDPARSCLRPSRCPPDCGASHHTTARVDLLDRKIRGLHGELTERAKKARARRQLANLDELVPKNPLSDRAGALSRRWRDSEVFVGMSVPLLLLVRPLCRC
jgi:hypothetical protein